MLIDLIDFETFYNIVGGAGLVGLSAQLVGILKINKDILEILAEIDSRREGNKNLGFYFNLPLETENLIESFDSINRVLKNIIYIICTSAISIGLYSIFKEFTFPLNAIWIWNTFALFQNIFFLFLTVVPILLTCYVFYKYINIHKIYFKILREGDYE